MDRSHVVSLQFTAASPTIIKCQHKSLRPLVRHFSHIADADHPGRHRQDFKTLPPITGYTLDFQSLIYVTDLYNGFLTDFADNNDLAGQFEVTLDHLRDDCHFNVLGTQHVPKILSECVQATGF